MIKKILRATLVVGVILLSSCSPKTEYTHALPKNASVVVGMELDRMADKAGLNGEEGEKNNQLNQDFRSTIRYISLQLLMPKLWQSWQK